MAKGQRGAKGGQSTATAANGPNNRTKAGDREDHQNSQSVKGQRNQRTNRTNKKEMIHNEEPKAEFVDDSPNSNHVNATEKKDAQHSSSIHPKVQPTTEQLMIAKIIDHSDDPHQRKKIQQVMDVTGKPEDEVATALFDAGWDESRAVELLLEDGDHLSAWEETGKKKKTKKSGQSNDKDEWDDDEGFHEGRDKSRGSKGPPRMRRGGGGGSNARGGSSGGLGGSSRDFTGENGNSEQVGQGGVSMGGRGGASRRGDQPPRRGGRGGGAGRNFSSRQNQSGQTHRDDRGHGSGLSSSNTGGFQGSIDTWNNPGDTTQNNSSSSAAGDRGHSGSGDHRGGRSGRGRGGGGRGGGSGKDAFDNAGNWGDDFPQADDWDNEEYTGSLKDTKIFTSSQAGGQGGGGRAKQKTPPSNQPQQQQQQPPVQQPTQQPPVGANSQRGGQGVAPGSSSSFSASLTSNGPTSSYSQSIDLSTLLQKPTTQSSVGSAAAAPGAQFNQQAATETLKSSLGIGQSSSGAKEPMYSYAQASAFTSLQNKPVQQGSSRGGPGGVPTSVQPQPNKPATQVVGGRGASNRGIAPSSSAKIPAVEMPGDSLGRLDVSFGGLDLQFGGSASANSESGLTGTSGFEFGTSEDKITSATSNIKPTSTGDVTSFAPSAKEVNKSLSNALTGGTGKLNAVSVQAATAVHTTQQDSFSKAASAVSTVSSSASANQPQAVGPTSGGSSGNYGVSGGSTGSNKPTQDLSGYNYNYKGYNNYQQYQYPTASNNYSSSAQAQQQQQQQHQSAGSGSQYKGGGQYDKYSQDPTSAQLQNNPAAAVLGLASTSTTNALSGKVSATTASKVNMPNLPPGVASMLHHPQYMATGLAPAAFYGLQQPMYGAYGQTAGFDDIAALQRATASAAGLHTLPTTGFYDPNNQFAAATSLGVAANNRDGSANLNSLTGTGSNTSSSAIGGSSSSAQPSAFTSTTTAANVSTTSPGPNAITTSASTGSGSQHAHHVQQQQQQHPQQQQQQQQTAFNLATNALAAQQMPPGYAYFYGNMAGAALPAAAYGAATANPSHVYQQTAAMTVPGATATSQFQQKTYGQTNNYGTGGYDNMSQQQYKQESNSYSSNGQSKSSGGSAGAGSGKGHQYWGNTLTSAPLW